MNSLSQLTWCAAVPITRLTDKESTFRNLTRVTLLVRWIPTQAKPPESVHLSIQHTALITDKGRWEAELRAQNILLS